MTAYAAVIRADARPQAVVSLLHRYPCAHQCCTRSASQRTSIDQQSRRSSEHRLSGESVSTADHRPSCRSGEGAASEGQPSAERRSFDRGSRGSFEGRPPLSPQVPPQALQGFSPFANAPAFAPTSQTHIGYVPVLTVSLSSNCHYAGSAAAELAPVVLQMDDSSTQVGHTSFPLTVVQQPLLRCV